MAWANKGQMIVKTDFFIKILYYLYKSWYRKIFENIQSFPTNTETKFGNIIFSGPSLVGGLGGL